MLWILRKAGMAKLHLIRIGEEEVDFLNSMDKEAFMPKVVISDACFTQNEYLLRKYHHLVDPTD